MSWTEQRTRQHLLARSGGRCELRVPGTCLGDATSAHHRVKRGQGGPWTPANTVHTCGDGTRGCHGWVELHPELARTRGWALPAGTDPEQAPAWLHTVNGTAWWLIDQDGMLTWCHAEPPAPPLC